MQYQIDRITVQKLLQFTLLAIFITAVHGAESIAEITQHDITLSSPAGLYELKLLAAANLSNITVGGYKVAELSGIAWDEDEKLLYALSDNGYVIHLSPVFENNALKDVLLLNGYALLDTQQRPLKYKAADSEGLALESGNNGKTGDTRLLISFERVPRIIKYTTDGKMIAELPLPAELADIGNYQGENKSLEAIAVHDGHGILTGPENSLKNSGQNSLDLYSMNGTRWSLPLHNPYYGALVDLTAMPDGNLLALERVYGGILPGLEISLHCITLQEPQAQNNLIYTFEAGNGYFDDDFEGVTHYRGGTYFMISDDNNHPLKNTVLVYFSITGKTGK